MMIVVLVVLALVLVILLLRLLLPVVLRSQAYQQGRSRAKASPKT